jgi:hypothetical protein
MNSPATELVSHFTEGSPIGLALGCRDVLDGSAFDILSFIADGTPHRPGALDPEFTLQLLTRMGSEVDERADLPRGLEIVARRRTQNCCVRDGATLIRSTSE